MGIRRDRDRVLEKGGMSTLIKTIKSMKKPHKLSLVCRLIKI